MTEHERPVDPYAALPSETAGGGVADESQVVTPPRGIDATGVPPMPSVAPAPDPRPTPGPLPTPPAPPGATPTATWGEVEAPHEPPPPIGPTSHWRVVAVVVALVVGLAGTAWFSTNYFRSAWLQVQGGEPTTPDASGTATVAGLSVSLVEATDLGSSPSLPGSDWEPPNGFHAWRVTLRTESTNPDLFSCDVAIVDEQGREFTATHFVENFADGYEFSYSCGVLEPDDEIGPEQSLMVLLPEDAVPVAVTVTSFTLDPDSIELPIG